MPKTSYFTKDGLQFLHELESHNEKAWFDANKARFESGLREPAQRLIGDLAAVLPKLSEHMVADPRPNGGSLSRIYRDTRFSKDKRPYKTGLFLRFQHDAGSEDAMPAFYMHIEPGKSVVGGGIWHPATPALEKIRQAIVASPAAWKKATSGIQVGRGCGMAGESLKKVPRGYDPEHPYAEDLKRKDFGMKQPLRDAALTGGELTGTIEEGFRAATPLLKFLCGAVGLSF